MLLDLNKQDIKENLIKGSIVIFGAGVSGIFLAYLLRNSGKKIIVIEKNNFPDLNIPNLQFKKKFKSEFYNKSFNAINKFFGGWSNYWGGLLVELKKNDIEKKYWGLSYNDLTKLYDEIYKIFDIKLDRDLLDKVNNIKNLENSSLKKYLSFYLKQPNFNYYFEKFIKNNKNVYFYYNCKINKVITHKSKIKSIEINNIKNKDFLVFGDMFVLSMGTYGNNQFLLSLKENDKNFLKYNDKIGSNIHDHIGIEVGKVIIRDKKNFRNHFENGFFNGSKYQPKIINKKNNLSISGQFNHKSNLDPQITEIKKFIKKFFLRSNTHYNKKYITFKGLFSFSKYIWHWIFHKRILNFTSQNISFYVQSEQSIVNSNTIKIIKNKNDKNFLKEINFDWKFNKDDFDEIKNFRESVNIFLKENKLATIKNFNLNYEFLKKNIESTYHLSGGTIISKNINSGVCSKSLKVWGSDNIFVSGASLFPCSGSANITLTILALTLKLSKKLKTL